MKWSARLLLLLAALMTPAYWLLDGKGWLPVSLRDRPWPLALAALGFSLLALPLLRRLKWLALIVAVASPLAIGWLAHWRYRLPPPSEEAGVGAPLPEMSLPDESGRAVRVGERDGRPLLLIWFRGSWCPYCRQQLAEVAADLPHFSPADLRVLAVSADPPEPLAVLRRELKLPFTLLSDPERRLVNRCQLAHCVAVVDRNGVVRWGVVSGNWQRDLPARALLQAAYRQE